ncbi:GTP-binding protein [Thalassobacillus sp. C254]|uniref:GTP-binding protein n=1 Tax=Thalassobacillus sp. C254 TaxID=1225341 RepID=UPI0006CF9D21|nr:GTP-binding protein [Thalassobacillus sp. C254]
MKEQVRYADMVLINKIDKVEPEEWASVRQDIQDLNPKAAIVPSYYSNVDVSLMFSKEKHTEKKKVSNTLNRDSHIENLHLHSVTLSLPHPIRRECLSDCVNSMEGCLFRLKGFVKLMESPEIFLLNYSYGELLFEPYVDEREVKPVLVFIGENLNPQQIKEKINGSYV